MLKIIHKSVIICHSTCRTNAGGLMSRFYMYLLNKTPYYAKINFIALIGLKAWCKWELLKFIFNITCIEFLLMHTLYTTLYVSTVQCPEHFNVVWRIILKWRICFVCTLHAVSVQSKLQSLSIFTTHTKIII